MLTKKSVLVATIVVLSIGSIRAALAFSPYTNGTVYFDENGQAVGQQVLDCEGQAWHGGNIHTAYHVSTSYVCGWPYPPPVCQNGAPGCPYCTSPDPADCPTPPNQPTDAARPEVGGGPQPPHYTVGGTLITTYVLPSFESVWQACSLMGDQCYEPPERLLDRGWTWLGGWE